MDKIKGVRKKQSDGSFTDLVPFGTNGPLVDMMSGLDLEQELKIGGLHKTTVQTRNENETFVQDRYYNSNDGTLQYIMETTIVENCTIHQRTPYTAVYINLWKEDEDEPIASKEIMISSGVASTGPVVFVWEGNDTISLIP